MISDMQKRNFTWINPEYKLPKDEEKCVVIIVTGKCYNVGFEKALLLGRYVQEEGWVIEDWEYMRDFIVHAWAEIEFPTFKDEKEINK